MGDLKKAECIAWVKLGKVWWPGKLLKEDEFSDEMKAEVEDTRTRKKLKSNDIHVVKFFNEDEFEVVHNQHQILLNVDQEKKLDLIKRAISSMKTSSLASNRAKFKTDVLHAEKLVNPTADLSGISKLLDGETAEPKSKPGVSKYADIFPGASPAKQEKTSPATSGKSKSSPGIKFNFPSSRIITTASSKPPSKVAPLPSDPSKKYKCSSCAFSADRVNVITSHMKYCSGKTPRKSTSNASPRPPAVTPPATSPKVKATPPSAIAAAIAVPVTTPVKRAAGRPPKSASTPIVTPTAASPAKLPKEKKPTVVATPTTSTAPKKRGRRRKDKNSEKKKAEILQDWNDSSSEENDSDDDIALQMPPTKPPELFLFGSEKKKRKAVESVAEVVDGENAEAAAAVGNEDEPPVLKKPRTDKELSAAFEALLKNTKPEYEKLLEKELPGDGKPETEEEEEEKMEVDEDEKHMSDIEEDAQIVMKKVNVVEKKEKEDKKEEKPIEKDEQPQQKEDESEEKSEGKVEADKTSPPKRRSTDEDDMGSGEKSSKPAEEKSEETEGEKSTATDPEPGSKVADATEKKEDKEAAEAVENSVVSPKIEESSKIVEESPKKTEVSPPLPESPQQPAVSAAAATKEESVAAIPEPVVVKEPPPTPVSTVEPTPAPTPVPDPKPVVKATRAKSAEKTPKAVPPPALVAKVVEMKPEAVVVQQAVTPTEVKATPAPLPPPPPIVVKSPPKGKGVVELPKPATSLPPPPPVFIKKPEAKVKKQVARQPPPPPIVVKEAPPAPTPAAAPSPPKAATATATPTPPPPPLKKPTAAVRPLVDTNTTQSQAQKETPPVTKDVKGAPSSTTTSQQKQQETTSQAPPSSQTKEESQEVDKSASLVAQRVVHLVPVENADGTITYMLLSLENGNDNQAMVLEQGTDQSGSVLRLDKVEPIEQGGQPNLPLNPTQVEGIFLDKDVSSANQIVSALTSAPTSATATSVMDTTTYVTLAMDASASSSLQDSSGQQAQSIVIPEGMAVAQDGSGDVQQQVFYMTEDGALLDPQSLGLTLEQLQQLLNQ